MGCWNVQSVNLSELRCKGAKHGATVQLQWHAMHAMPCALTPFQKPAPFFPLLLPIRLAIERKAETSQRFIEPIPNEV